MAAAAETIQYINVDDLPDVAAARQIERNEAQALLETRRTQIERGEYQYVPLAIDVLSTAHHVLGATEQYGPDSPERQALDDGLWLDCHRLLTEWYRKNTSEYFPAVYHAFDPTTEDFYSHGLLIGQMTMNALTPQETPEDEDRRVNERVEEATPQLLRKLGGFALAGARVRTISECTDAAVDAYVHDFATGKRHQGYNGYVPEIEKVMIRDLRFDEASDGRYDEQIGIPGVYINHEVFQKALLRRGIDTTAKNKTELHATQMVAHDDLIDFVELLDTVGGEHWNQNLFQGEVVPADHPKDYESIRSEAQVRQEGLKAHSNMVKDFVLSLAENKTDPRKAPEIVEAFVKKLLLNMARHDVSLATQIFDHQTAEGLHEVAYLESIGRYDDAFELYDRVEANAPGGGYCGAGSCGLESIAPGSAEEAAVKKLGFGDSKDVIKDTERRCKCGSKSVYYDLKQAKKGCTSCGKTAKY